MNQCTQVSFSKTLPMTNQIVLLLFLFQMTIPKMKNKTTGHFKILFMYMRESVSHQWSVSAFWAWIALDIALTQPVVE